MASGGKSGWGSLLSKAVAGVEARLDTILAEGEETQKDNKSGQQAPPVPAPTTVQKRSPGMSTGKCNARYQVPDTDISCPCRSLENELE